MQSALNVAEKSETERSSETATKSSHIYILNMRESRFARFTHAFLILRIFRSLFRPIHDVK